MEDFRYWNIFYTPIHRIGDKVNVAITTFECADEEKVRELFLKSYVGVEDEPAINDLCHDAILLYIANQHKESPKK